MYSIPEPDQAGLRKFAFTLAIAIVLLFGIVFPWILEQPAPHWPWMVSGLFVIWGIFKPGSLKMIYILWMRLGLVLNRVTSPVLLGLIFFLIITPMGYVMRQAGKLNIKTEFEKKTDTYRVISDKDQAENMERPF